MEFTEKKGNLFNERSSLAHCVSLDFEMSAGIALTFKQKYGGIVELKQQKRKVGECSILQRDDKFIFYLITKERYFHKPTLENLRKSLEYLRELCSTYDVTNLSMPRIGCGMDNLDWDAVRDTIKDVFKNTDINITICSM